MGLSSPFTNQKTKDLCHKLAKWQSWPSKNTGVLTSSLVFYYFTAPSLSVGNESNMLSEEKERGSKWKMMIIGLNTGSCNNKI